MRVSGKLSRTATPVHHEAVSPGLVVPQPAPQLPPMMRSPGANFREVLVAHPLASFVQVNPLEPVVADLQNQFTGLHMSLQAEAHARETNGVNIIVTLNELAALSHTVSKHESMFQNMQDELMHYGREKLAMQTDIDELKAALQAERNGRSICDVKIDELQKGQFKCDIKIGELHNELQTMKSHLSEFDGLSQNDLQRSLHRIEERGNVQVNFDSGDIQLIRPIKFAPRTTRDKPTAEFTQPEIADAICQDLASIMSLFVCPVTVEGHTKGGEGEFWQKLADQRAHVVVQRMVDNGADPTSIKSQGLPGTLGLNETVTKVRLDLPEEAKQTVRRHTVRPSFC